MTETRNYDAEIAALVRARDIAALDNLKLAQAILKRPAVAQAIADIEALAPNLPDDGSIGSTRQQFSNVASVTASVRDLFDREVARVQTLVDAQAAAA